MNVEGKKVLVVGTGKSGIAAAALLAKEKAAPVLFDENKDTDAEEVKKKLPDAEIGVITGTLPEGILDELELAVLSPGVPVDTPFVENSGTRVSLSGVKWSWATLFPKER